MCFNMSVALGKQSPSCLNTVTLGATAALSCESYVLPQVPAILLLSYSPPIKRCLIQINLVFSSELLCILTNGWFFVAWMLTVIPTIGGMWRFVILNKVVPMLWTRCLPFMMPMSGTPIIRVIIRCYSNSTFPQSMLLIWIAGMM